MENQTESNEQFASVILPGEDGIALRDRFWVNLLLGIGFDAIITVLLMVIYRFVIFYFLPVISWVNWWKAGLAVWISLVLSWLCLEGMKGVWRWARQRINYVGR